LTSVMAAEFVPLPPVVVVPLAHFRGSCDTPQPLVQIRVTLRHPTRPHAVHEHSGLVGRSPSRVTNAQCPSLIPSHRKHLPGTSPEYPDTRRLHAPGAVFSVG